VAKYRYFFRITKWTKEQLKPEELNKFLLAQDNERHKAWHVAAKKDNVDVIRQIVGVA